MVMLELLEEIEELDNSFGLLVGLHRLDTSLGDESFTFSVIRGLFVEDPWFFWWSSSISRFLFPLDMIVLDVDEDEEIEEDSFDSSPLGRSSSSFNVNFFFKWVFHTFLISLSVLPGKWDAIFDHLRVHNLWLEIEITNMCLYSNEFGRVFIFI